MGKGTFFTDEQKGMMRKLYLEQGWGFMRIGSYLKVSGNGVMQYLKRTGLVEKKKAGKWEPSDVLLPSEAVHQAIEREKKREQWALKGASQKGAQLAERVVAEVLTREQMAKDALLKITAQADSLAARMKQAIDHMQEMQTDGKAVMDKEGNVVMIPGTNMRDFKDLTASYLNIIRATRELSGEVDGPSAKPDKHMPVRIGVIGNVRISGGGVEVESAPQHLPAIGSATAGPQNGREPLSITVDG